MKSKNSLFAFLSFLSFLGAIFFYFDGYTGRYLELACIFGCVYFATSTLLAIKTESEQD
jgi:hypothetical protein